MRVLQLIDSLDPGGAERMAVTFANSLADRVSYSALCATRKEGLLKQAINKKVDYLFLEKTGTFDLRSLRRLVKFVRKNNIEIIHTHSSGFYFAWLVKLFRPNIKLFWHDHYGKSEQLHDRKAGILKFCSRSFDGIISVNKSLKNWAEEQLDCDKVMYLRNFVDVNDTKPSDIRFEGNEKYRIVCLANFRPQKDHYNILKAFEIIRENQPEAELHLIGRTVDLNYYEGLGSFIAENNLENVTFHGEQSEIVSILHQCAVGVLSSNSEGLPVALLEYGVAGIAVVTTDVGECATVVNGYGKIVESEDHRQLATAVLSYFEDEERRQRDAGAFQKHIMKNYSVAAVLPELLAFYSD